MSEYSTEPVETKTFADAKAGLYSDRTLNLGPDVNVAADYMTVERSMGHKDEVLIYSHDGVRRVLDVRQTLEIQGSSPAVPASAKGGVKLEPVDAEKEKQLLRIYDQFETRTWR